MMSIISCLSASGKVSFVASRPQVDHDVTVAMEEHYRTRIVELVHRVAGTSLISTRYTTAKLRTVSAILKSVSSICMHVVSQSWPSNYDDAFSSARMA